MQGSLLSLLERLRPDCMLHHAEYRITISCGVMGGFIIQYDAYTPPAFYGAACITELLMAISEARALSKEWQLQQRV